MSLCRELIEYLIKRYNYDFKTLLQNESMDSLSTTRYTKSTIQAITISINQFSSTKEPADSIIRQRLRSRRGTRRRSRGQSLDVAVRQSSGHSKYCSIRKYQRRLVDPVN